MLEAAVSLPAGSRALVLAPSAGVTTIPDERDEELATSFHRLALATVRFDLLTATEVSQHPNLFDIARLADRLQAATAWIVEQEWSAGPLGCFATGTAAAAAVIVAARDPGVRAVVTRAGRADLASSALPRVKAPTLLLVGGRDFPLLATNEDAHAQLRCEKALVTVPGANHLFEEPGTSAHADRLAGAWFVRHLVEER